jgi:hypothetical protein
MRELRDAQTRLNYFVWTTELSYGSALTSKDPRLADAEAFAAEALADVESQAWFPNTAGRIKYHGRIASFLDQLRRNPATLAQATLVLWYTHFEKYLANRVDPKLGKEWGPLTKSLRRLELTSSVPYPLNLQTVLRADLCRIVRNLMVHEDRVPSSLTDPAILKWTNLRRADLQAPENPATWAAADPDTELKEAVGYVVGQALNHLRDPQVASKDLTLGFFYALFSFTNLDTLACEIEEAVQPRPADTTITVRRQLKKVRRADLIVPAAGRSKGNE